MASAAASWAKVRSPTSAYVGAPVASARPAAVDTQPSMPASPRLATADPPPAVARSRSRTALDDPTNRDDPAGSARATTAAMARPEGHELSSSGLTAPADPP